MTDETKKSKKKRRAKFFSNMMSTLIGALIGGALSITGIIWQARWQDEQKAQEWFDEYYIQGGVDKILSALSVLELSIISEETNISIPRTFKPEFSVEAVMRIERLLEKRPASAHILALSTIYSKKAASDRSIEQFERDRSKVNELQSIFRRLKNELIDFEENLKKKTQVNDIKNQENIATILKDLQKELFEN